MCRVAVDPVPLKVPELCPTMVICGLDKNHAMVPETAPRTTSRRFPVGMEVGRVPPVVTTMVSASEAQRPSWWLMQTPGPIPVHSVSAVHARQALVAVLQMGVVPPQSVLLVHWTHAPAEEQAGVAGLLAAHWLDVVQAVHVSVVAEQMGVAPAHVALAVQPTHLFVAVSQTGVAPEHCVFVVHWTHAPAEEQAGVAGLLAAHWLAAVQAVQVWVVAEQMGVAPEHVALAAQPTHLVVAVSQTGVAPEQVLSSVHWAHWPSARHAGRAGFFARHWAAAVHPAQILVGPQMGAVAPHVALLRQPTQVFVVVSQTDAGPAAEQSVFLVHWTQVPVVAHTARVGSASPAH